MRTDLSDDASFIYDEDDDDNNAPLEDLKRYVATLNEQRDLDLENFKGLYDDDSDDDSDWGENMDFEKVTSDFLSYAMGKENKVRAGTPRSTTLSKSIILKTAKGLSISHSVKTPRGILTPKDANVFAFEQEEITNSQATKADPQGDFASIELTLSDMLSEILSDDWKLDADERKEIRNGEQDEQIVETDFDVKSADGCKLESNECGRTEIIEQQDKQQDQEKDKPVEDAIMQGAESPSAENMPMGLETEGSKAIGEASSVDTSVDTATSYLDLIQETQEVAIEENAPINDSADLIPTKTKLDAEENSNKASSHVEVDDELICEGVAPVEYSIASNYPITSDTCDREAVTDQNHFHIMAEHEFGAESAEQEVPERLTEDTKHECKAQQAPIEEDPYEWAYAIWRAKGLMGRTKEDDHQTPSKPQPIRNGEQDEQIVETDFDVKSADGCKLESNECGRTEIIEQQDKQQDQEKDKPVEDAIMQGAESPSAENMPMGLETEGSKAIGEASSVDTSVDTATSYLDLIQETQEVAIEENAPINDSADLIPTKTKLDAEENSNKASSHVEVDDELICEGVAPVEYSIASNYPITSDTCDREAVTDQNHFHIMAEHEFGAESAEQEVPERLTEDTKHECKAQQAPIEEDPYEWAYAIWRAKGLMGRTKEDDHQTPSKPQPSMSRKVNHAPIPPSEPKVFVIGTPVKESQSVTATTPGRDRAGQWNKRASGNFGNLIQRWKDKSESTPIHNLFSPAQSVQSVVASTPIKATEEGRKAERATIDIDKDTALSKKVRTDGIVALSTSGKYEVVAELRGNDKNSNEKVMTKTGNEEDAIIGMTIGDLKGRKSLFTPTPIKVLRTFLAQGEGSVGDMDDDSSISYDGLVCMSDQSQIANAQHAQGCACSSSAFSGNDVLEEFFLPQLGMACTCGTGKRSYNWRYDSDPTALEHILRPWQVSFCHSFGIRKGDQLVKAHHRSANMLAKAMRKWRSAHGMTRVRTVSCGVALNIWAQSCKFYVRSVRRQTDRGIRRIEMPNAMDCLTEMMSTSGRRMSVPASGHGFRTERAMTDGHSETEVEI